MTDNNKEKEFDLKDELIADRKVGFFNKPDDMSDLSYNTIIYIDKFNLLIGKIVSWIIVPLFLAMVYEVIARKFFLAPTMWAYDMSRFMYGGMFMLGAAYALSRGVHIRADFLYRNFKIKNQGLVDFWLYLIFYFPGLIFFLYMTTGFVLESIQRQEKGMDTAWMPLLWPIKACLWFGIVFLLIQGVSELLKSYYAMKKGRWPGDE
jgi:TRAP-type mannitol/chloroaromatic compound transport system permease small subunit